MAPQNVEQAKACFIFWLLLTTNSNFTAPAHDGSTIVPQGWDPDHPPANMTALFNPAALKNILAFLATQAPPAALVPVKTYFDAIRIVQYAFNRVATGAIASADRDNPPPYTPGDPNCPRFEDLSQLVLSYPAAAQKG